MQPESGNPVGVGAPSAGDRPAAFLAWPVIVLSMLVIIFGARFVPEAAKAEAAESDLGRLVILQLQVRPIVGIAPLDLKQALGNLELLQRGISTDREAAAVAAVHAFIDPGEQGRARADAVIVRHLEKTGAGTDFIEAVQAGIREGVSSEVRGKLAGQLGWFARLFPLEGRPDEFPDVEETRAQGFVTAAVLALSVLAGALFFLAGAALLIKGFTRRKQGNLPFAFSPDDRTAGVWLESFAIYLGGMAAGSAGKWLFDEKLYPGFGLAGIVLAILWPLFRGCSWKRLRQSIGWTRGRGVFREVGAGVAGYLIVLPFAAAGFAIMLGLGHLIQVFQGTGLEGKETTDLSHPAIGWMLGGWQAKLFIFLFAAIVAPLVEETLFRGVLFRALRGRWSFVASGLVSGLIFAAIHPQGLLAIPPLMAMGFGFALIREWRDSLIAPMTAHAINNGLLLGVLSSVVS